MEPPWSRARKLRYQKQEERLRTLPGGRKGLNSGRFWNVKRDGKLYDFLVEARTNEKPNVTSYRIEYEEWQNLRRDALREPPGLKPAMQVTIRDLDLIVIELRDFQDMQSRLVMLETNADES